MDYVLDACALIAFLNDEAGADTVAGLLTQSETGDVRLLATEESGEFPIVWLA